MLATLQSVLRKAQRGRYAVGAFNVSDLEQVQAVVRAAIGLRAPVIVNTSEKAIAYAGLDELAALVKTMAKKAPVPIVLNLDHGRSVTVALSCLRAGYTGIMFDGSRLPYETNVRATAAVVRAAHRRRIGTEGELGRVIYPGERVKTKDTLTDPEQARDFVRRTKIDALAVGIGNSHGLPRPGERLDFRRLAALRRVVTAPLVLHGASGTPASDIRRAIRLGVCKINIDTDLRLAFSQAVRRAERQQPREFDPRSYLAPARQAMMDVVRAKITLFGSRGKGR